MMQFQKLRLSVRGIPIHKCGYCKEDFESFNPSIIRTHEVCQTCFHRIRIDNKHRHNLKRDIPFRLIKLKQETITKFKSKKA